MHTLKKEKLKEKFETDDAAEVKEHTGGKGWISKQRERAQQLRFEEAATKSSKAWRKLVWLSLSIMRDEGLGQEDFYKLKEKKCLRTLIKDCDWPFEYAIESVSRHIRLCCEMD